VLLLAVAGCKSTTEAESAAQTMRDMKQALNDAPEKITAVSTTLEELAKEGGDMKAEFAKFSGNVDALTRHRDSIRALRKEVEGSRSTFTAAWEERMKNIKDEELRKRAEERRSAVITEFGELTKIADSGREEFEPWMQTVLDVRTYLENDLNPTGVASVRDKVRTVRDGAASVNKKIGTVVASLDKMSQSIAAAKPPAEPAEATQKK
jgi:chromosome segregation ATPase